MERQIKIETSVDQAAKSQTDNLNENLDATNLVAEFSKSYGEEFISFCLNFKIYKSTKEKWYYKCLVSPSEELYFFSGAIQETHCEFENEYQVLHFLSVFNQPDLIQNWFPNANLIRLSDL
jgi:hypothetical protein